MANVPDLVVTVKNSGVRSTVISSPGGAAMKLVQLDDVTPLPRANGDVLTWITANGKFEFHAANGGGGGSSTNIDQFARDNSNGAFTKANTANVTGQAAFDKANSAIYTAAQIRANISNATPILYNSTTGVVSLIAPTANGQLLIGNTVSGGYDVHTLIAGSGLAITNTPGNVTVSYNDTGASVFQNDDFLGGSVSSGQLGKLGWQVFGAASRPAAAVNNPGQVRSTTNGSPGAAAGIFLPEATDFLASRTFELVFIARLVQSDANTEARIGVSQGASMTPTEGVFFRKYGADTVWKAVCVTGGTETITSTGVSTDANYHYFRIRNVGGSMVFSVNGSADITIATNIPTVAMVMIAMIATLTTDVKSLDVDYFAISITGITRI